MTEPTLPATADVVVVGAGLAGLAAAHALSASDLHVLVLEAEDHVGGRVHTDRIDGFLVDRGFQLYNPAYPEGRRVLDHDALALRPFSRGVLVSRGDRCWRLGDPRAHPTWLGDAARSPLGGVSDKARFAAYAWRTGRSTPARLRSRPDTSTATALRAAGLSDRFVDSVVRPFLTGVFLEPDLSTSRRFFDLVVRSFVRGTPSVPAAGMSAIPVQLAAALPEGSVRLSTPVVSVVSGGVDTDAGTVTARAVVVATGPAAAGALLSGLVVPDCHAVTTWYHVADDAGESLAGGLPALVVDADRRGPVVNTAVMSNVAPTYSPPARALVASSVLGVRDDPDTEAAVRTHLGLLYRTDTRRWETLAVRAVRHALPAMPAPHDFAKPVRLGDGLYVAGDHRDSSSIQGALVSGRRAARAVLSEL